MQQSIFNSLNNLLPSDGVVNYFGPVFDPKKSDQHLENLLRNVEWRNDENIIFGRRIITKRKVAWYGDHPFEYKYSQVTKTALPWTSHLKDLKEIVEDRTGETYNSCLMNLYHNGEEGVSWHSDGEPDLKPNGAIASLSFGASRRFCFKHKEEGTRAEVLLKHGDLLVMKDQTQKHWLHSIPKMKSVKTVRISLTFRTIIE